MKNSRSVRLIVAAAVASVVAFACGGEERPWPSKRGNADVINRRDALSSGLVISQVYGGGGNSTAIWTTDYIELFNRGTTAVNVNGWSVQYAGATGSSWNPTLLPNVTIQPGQYFLIAEQTTAGMGAALPVTADVTDSIAMSALNGKVALVNGTTGLTGTCPTGANIVDFVGYGSANCSEAAPAAVLNAAAVEVRNANGCAETDNNSNDFTVVSGASPRNTNSTRNTCSGTDGGSGTDAGRPDSGVDAGRPDAGVDAGRPDSGVVDAGSGMDASCTVLSTWPSLAASAGYDAVNEFGFVDLYTQAPATADGGMDFLTVETYLGFGLMLPTTVMFDDTTSFTSCEVCPMLRKRCNTMTCQKRFLAQAGSATITTVTPDEQAGQYVGSLSNVTFREWNFSTDALVPGGECVTVTSLNINVTWDAGVGPTGGGGGATGGGGGTTGGGGGATGGGGGATGGGGGATGGGGGTTGGGGGATGGGGGRPPRQDGGMGGGGGTMDGGSASDAGTGGGAGGGAGGAGGGATGGGTTTGGGVGGGLTGGGVGGGGGGGGLKGTSGCSCSSEMSLAFPLLMLLGLVRSRRRPQR